MPRRIYAAYYGKLLIVAYFNAGLQVFDIRDPFNPRRVAYFVQAPNRNTESTCGTFAGNTHYCRKAAYSDLGEVDDRGYIYNMDRAGSGLTILSLTGDALAVVAARPFRRSAARPRSRHDADRDHRCGQDRRNRGASVGQGRT
jgi:hypothetical protein